MASPYSYKTGYPFGDPSEFTRSTREDELDRFNQWMRVQPWYQDYLKSQGLVDTGKGVKMSDRQQKDVENLLLQQGIKIPDAFHIDAGGNLNQHNRLWRNIGIGVGAGLGAWFGAPALFGALGGSGAAGGAAGAAAAGGGAGAGAATAGTLAATAPGWGMATLAPTVAPALGAGAGAAGAAGAGIAAGAGAAGAAGAGAAPLAASSMPVSMGTLAPTVPSAMGAATGAGGGMFGLTGLETAFLGANIGSGLYNAYQQGKISKEELAERARQFNVQQENVEQQLALEQGQRALDAAQANPTRVGWRQNQALAAALLPELRNVSVSSPIPGMNAFIPQISGGLRLPASGFSPDTLKFFGDKAMLAGEQDLDTAAQIASGGQAPLPSYPVVYGEQALPAQNAVASAQQRVREDEKARAARRAKALQGALKD